MNIVWTHLALSQFQHILSMVADYASTASAQRYALEFERLITLAQANPQMGKKGIIPNTRELYPINGKYRIVYRVMEERFIVLTIKSTKQRHTLETYIQDWQEETE